MREEFLQDVVNRYCQTNNIKKKDFAEKIGVTPAKLSHWLAGRTRFSLTTLEKVKSVLKANF